MKKLHIIIDKQCAKIYNIFEDYMTLKEFRKSKNISQEQVAKLIGVSRRTYINYENDESKLSEFKRSIIIDAIEKSNLIDESHGVLTIDEIKKTCNEVFSKYDIKYAYLFGSYAKNKATATSDVDLLVEGNVEGLKYFEFLEVLRESLNKKVDVLDTAQLLKNNILLNDILKDGIKIYG